MSRRGQTRSFISPPVTPRPGESRSERDGDGLLLGVSLDAGEAELAADAARLESAPGQARVGCARAVDPHATGAKLRCEPVRLAEILRPHVRGEPVARVVGDGDRV